MKKVTAAVLSIIIFCFAQCKKTPPSNTSEIPGLPPATQTGANTLGFLLNGVPWVPAGFNGTANLSIDFDPGFNTGIMSIGAYSKTSTDDSFVTFGIKDSLNFITIPNTYNIGRSFLGGILFRDKKFCERRSEDRLQISSGFISILKLDRTNNIISGVLECKLFNPTCGDTIIITNGRFDIKF